jgi:hypothetical protein
MLQSDAKTVSERERGKEKERTKRERKRKERERDKVIRKDRKIESAKKNMYFFEPPCASFWAVLSSCASIIYAKGRKEERERERERERKRER